MTDESTSRGCATLIRETRESRVSIDLNLHGTGRAEVSTGIAYLNHVLVSFARHGRFDLALKCEGSVRVSQLHSVEDTGQTLGHAVHKAVRSQLPIVRFGCTTLPVDEVLARVALDFSGRPYLHFEVPWHVQLGPMSYDFHLTREFFWGFARTAGATVHVDLLTPGNNHHMCDAVFKAFGRSMRDAVRHDPLSEPTSEDLGSFGEAHDDGGYDRGTPDAIVRGVEDEP